MCTVLLHLGSSMAPTCFPDSQHPDHRRPGPSVSCFDMSTALLLLGEMTVTTCTADSETNPRLGTQAGPSARHSSAAQLESLLTAKSNGTVPQKLRAVPPKRCRTANGTFISLPPALLGSGRRVVLPLLRTSDSSKTALTPLRLVLPEPAPALTWPSPPQPQCARCAGRMYGGRPTAVF